MAITRPSVGGPDFVRRVKEAEELVRKLEASNWDFDAVPEVYAKNAHADVLAKEIALFFDGSRQTMIGRLIMGGVGSHFNLMGGHHADAEFLSKPNTVLDDINKELGTEGLQQFPIIREMAPPQKIYFYNRNKFFQLRDLIFWHLLYGAGCFPSALETMARHFAIGKAVYNNMYRPPRPSYDSQEPAIMTSEGSDLFLSFPTKTIEFMEPSIHGGLYTETMHIEYILTLEPAKISHPRLPLDGEAEVHVGGQRWFLRRFMGTAPKVGARGPEIPPEGQTHPAESRGRRGPRAEKRSRGRSS